MSQKGRPQTSLIGESIMVTFPRPCSHYGAVSQRCCSWRHLRPPLQPAGSTRVVGSAEHCLVAGLPLSIVVMIMATNILPVIGCQRGDLAALNSACHALHCLHSNVSEVIGALWISRLVCQSSREPAVDRDVGEQLPHTRPAYAALEDGTVQRCRYLAAVTN